jgi:twinkle protein
MTFSDFNISIPPGRTYGQIKAICPQCSHDRKKKSDKCLSINIDQGIWKCYNCGWTGSLHKKPFTLPKWENKTNLSENVVEWFLKRNISQKTLLDMRISEQKEFMPQAGQDRNVICFNYFREGKLINVKYRDRDKNFKMVKDAERIFYNLDGIKDQNEIYIVEGEMDCLTMIQSGFKNCVSVPNGATPGRNNMEYLDNCWEYFMGAEKVYLLTDNDEPGKKLSDELARRIGFEKCYRVDLGVYKDINEVLCANENVSEYVSNASPFPIEGIFSVEDFWLGVEDILKNGLPKGWMPRGSLKDFISFHPGYTTIITGIPGHGKSYFLDDLVLWITIDYNLRGVFFSPETMPTELHIIRLIKKIVGKSAYQMNFDERTKVRKFITERLYWIYPQEDFSLQSVLGKVRQGVLRYGWNWYIIDPWNKLEHRLEQGLSETNYISRCLDDIDRFNKLNKVHCFLVAHPTKMGKDEAGNYKTPTLYDISGSANFFNKTDNGLCVYRHYDSSASDVHIQKVKFEHWGKIGTINYGWSKETGRFYEGLDHHLSWIDIKTPEEQIEVPF